ncbi:MAG: WS/DGAT domain-containing protein [Chromatiales bacterium]
MKKLSLLDLAFFVTESEDSPKHVAGLMIFKRPAKSPARFVSDLFEEFMAFDKPGEPFDHVINFTALGGPQWQKCTDFDIDQHLFFHKPKKTLDDNALYELVAELHGPMLDRSLPLWQFHMIDRVAGGRFAVYFKIRTDGRTPLTGQVTPARQFAKASVTMDRVQRIRDMCRATLNHVALTCVDGALHRYLAESGADLQRPISIQMPVNLRDENDSKGGNKIGIVTVELANRTDDPYQRLREIGFTLRNVRNQIDGVPPAAVAQYSILLGVAAQLTEMLRLNNVLPPISDTLVSNVPGPRKPLYLKGARMTEMCPVSTLMPGNHLNITLYSYAGTLHFGLLATRELRDVAKLATYIEDAFVELEQAVFTPRERSAK